MASKHPTEMVFANDLRIALTPHPGDPTRLVGPVRITRFPIAKCVGRAWWNGRELVDERAMRISEDEIRAVEKALRARNMGR